MYKLKMIRSMNYSLAPDASQYTSYSTIELGRLNHRITRRSIPYREQRLRDERLINISSCSGPLRREAKGVSRAAERSSAPTNDTRKDVGVVVEKLEALSDDFKESTRLVIIAMSPG